MKHQRVHFLDGYVVDGKQVRARCTCGFLTLPHVSQRPARVALVRGHGLSTPACELCGRGETQDPVWRLPAILTVLDEDGRDRIVCAPGSGGCDRTLADQTRGDAQQGRASSTRPATHSYHRAHVRAQQAQLLQRAHDALRQRHQITDAQAAAALEQLAFYHAITLVDAARRVLGAAGGGSTQ
ncbi:hypothetical protein [Solicola sp. PLA-1-18]|uniref:hypothetical protein n=1 Tax=Solicola sp. PLA-1-18 TaxID=3380532 RepID=UPI003B7B4CBF